MRACCLLLIVGACVETPPEPEPSPLSAFPGFTLDVNANRNGVGVKLTTFDEYSTPCPALLNSFVATLDGIPMDVENAYISDVGLDFPEYDCTVPSVHTSQHGRSLHIADESAAFDLDLGDATDERAMELSTTDITRGASFDITWSPATDLAEGTQNVYLSTERADRVLDYTVDGGTMHVAMPAPLEFLSTGSGELYVTVIHEPSCPYSPCHITTRNSRIVTVTVH